MNGVAVQVFFLAEAFHDQLLEIAGEENQTVGIRNNDHVAVAFALAGKIPHGGKHVGGIVGELGIARKLVHVARAAEKALEVDSCKSRRKMPHDAGLAGAPADGLRHFEHLEPVVVARKTVEFASAHGDRAGMLPEVDLSRLILLHADDHIVFGFLCAAGFGDVDHESRFEVADLKRVIKPRSIGVVKEINTQIMIALFGGKLVPVGTVDRHLEKLRAERGTADAVDDRRIELFAGGTFDHAGADLFDKVLHLIVDRGAGINGTVREMRDLSVLIGIFDLALFDFLHFKIHADEFLIESVDVLIRKIHSGKIDLKSAFAVNEGISVTPVDPFCSHFRPPWKFSV